jgi:hypothetical protein
LKGAAFVLIFDKIKNLWKTNHPKQRQTMNTWSFLKPGRSFKRDEDKRNFGGGFAERIYP